jgi:hypothetical protein
VIARHGVAYASLAAGLIIGLLVLRELWWLAGLVAPIAVIAWPQVAGDPNRSWSGGDFTYEAVAVLFAFEILCGFYLAVGLEWGLRRLVRWLGDRPVATGRS